MIDDFEDGDNQLFKAGDRTGYWFSSADPDGSTIEPKPLTMSDGGANGSRKALHIFGQTSSSSTAWGVLVGVNFLNETGAVYDASAYAGISFMAKAGKDAAKSVRFKVADVNTHPDGGVCKNCWNHFGADVPLTTEWQEHTVMFADLKQEPGWGDRFPSVTPSKLIGLNWAYGPGKAFDLWVDNVQFIECK